MSMNYSYTYELCSELRNVHRECFKYFSSEVDEKLHIFKIFMIFANFS